MSLLKFLQRKETEHLLWETEDSGLTVQVWEKQERRELRFGNHILQSVYSRSNPNHMVLPYSRFMLLGLNFFPNPKTALHLGLGGGSIPRWLHNQFPHLQQTIIESSSAVIEAAQRFFDFPVDKRLNVILADATQFIKKLNSEFDLIFLDAFGEYGAPEESAHTEFLHDLSCCLNKEGWLVGNLWTITGDFMERRAQWESTFRQLFQARANEKGNIILYASQNSKTHDKQTIKEISKYLHKRHQLDFHRMHNKLEAVK